MVTNPLIGQTSAIIFHSTEPIDMDDRPDDQPDDQLGNQMDQQIATVAD